MSPLITGNIHMESQQSAFIGVQAIQMQKWTVESFAKTFEFMPIMSHVARYVAELVHN